MYNILLIIFDNIFYFVFSELLGSAWCTKEEIEKKILENINDREVKKIKY